MKSRKEKFYIYEDKYGDIPEDNRKRLEWMYDKYKLNEKKANDIIDAANTIYNQSKFETIKIVLFEEPEGSPRPRFRIVNRYNMLDTAMSNSQFVHVYSITGKEDNVHMQRLMSNGEIGEVKQILYTPCEFIIDAYVKTPSTFPVKDIFLSEVGLIRPLNKPDWDNIGKKYSDMLNGNIWLDDTLVVDGTVRKFYSIKPRVEITIRPLNAVYNKYQYDSTMKKLEKLKQPQYVHCFAPIKQPNE